MEQKQRNLNLLISSHKWKKINTLGPIKNGMLVTFKIKSFADNDTTIVIK